MLNKNELIDLFIANSDKMIKELENGKDIIIKKNKDNYVFYINMIKKLK